MESVTGDNRHRCKKGETNIEETTMTTTTTTKSLSLSSSSQPQAINKTTTNFYDVEHLATFSIAESYEGNNNRLANNENQNNVVIGKTSDTLEAAAAPAAAESATTTKTKTIKTPKVALQRLFELEKLSGIWTQRMQIELRSDFMLIVDCESNSVVEKFNRDSVTSAEAFNQYNDIYNNIVVFLIKQQQVKDDKKKKKQNSDKKINNQFSDEEDSNYNSNDYDDDDDDEKGGELHIFQCVSHQAQELVADILFWKSHPTSSVGKEQNMENSRGEQQVIQEKTKKITTTTTSNDQQRQENSASPPTTAASHSNTKKSHLPAISNGKPVVTVASSAEINENVPIVNVNVKETVQVFNQIAALREKSKPSSPTNNHHARPLSDASAGSSSTQSCSTQQAQGGPLIVGSCNGNGNVNGKHQTSSSPPAAAAAAASEAAAGSQQPQLYKQRSIRATLAPKHLNGNTESTQSSSSSSTSTSTSCAITTQSANKISKKASAMESSSGQCSSNKSTASSSSSAASMASKGDHATKSSSYHNHNHQLHNSHGGSQQQAARQAPITSSNGNNAQQQQQIRNDNSERIKSANNNNNNGFSQHNLSAATGRSTTTTSQQQQATTPLSGSSGHHKSSSSSSSRLQSRHHSSSSQQQQQQQRSQAASDSTRSSSSSQSQLDQTMMTNESYVSVLNHCFDDIEKFIICLQQAGAALRELQVKKKSIIISSSSTSGSSASNSSSSKQGGGGGGGELDNHHHHHHHGIKAGAAESSFKNGAQHQHQLLQPTTATELAMLTARARGPNEDEYFEILSKFKLSFNLLAKLKGCIHEPNAPELVHFLFTPLAIIIEAARNATPSPIDPTLVGIPYLNQDALDLLSNCCTSKESDMWLSLGPNWTQTIDKSLLRVSRLPTSFQPIFSDGWAPIIGELELIGLVNPHQHQQQANVAITAASDKATSPPSSGGVNNNNNKSRDHRKRNALLLPTAPPPPPLVPPPHHHHHHHNHPPLIEPAPIDSSQAYLGSAQYGVLRGPSINVAERVDLHGDPYRVPETSTSGISSSSNRFGAGAGAGGRRHHQTNYPPVIELPDGDQIDLDLPNHHHHHANSRKFHHRNVVHPDDYNELHTEYLDEDEDEDDYDDAAAAAEEAFGDHPHHQMPPSRVSHNRYQPAQHRVPRGGEHHHLPGGYNQQRLLYNGGISSSSSSGNIPRQSSYINPLMTQTVVDNHHPLSSSQAVAQFEPDHDYLAGIDHESMLLDLGPAQIEWFFELQSKGSMIVRALYTREANNEKELSVRRGEVLEILDASRKWWRARNINLQVAHVPHTIVAVMQGYQTLDELLANNPPNNDQASDEDPANHHHHHHRAGGYDTRHNSQQQQQQQTAKFSSQQQQQQQHWHANSSEKRNNSSKIAGAFRYF